MKVRMRCAVAGIPSYAAGDEVELRDDIAAEWIACGMAEPIADLETATAAAVVTTRVRGSRKR